MGDVITWKANLPAELQEAFNTEELAGDLYDGVSGGFAVVSFRGSKWRIKHGGEENPILNENEEPVASLECVLVKASKNVSKIFYAEQYEEGDDSAPDCWSIDGIKPDSASPDIQSQTCAACPNNVWGSKISPAGKKTKLCSDNRRVAVVPLGDIANEALNGPMLLRVPAASLADLATYGKGMATKGFPYNAIGTRIGFDLNASYPKLTFKPIRKLTDEELAEVAGHFSGETLGNILDVPQDLTQTAQPEVQPKPKPAPQPAVSLDFEDEEPPVAKTAKGKGGGKKKAAAKKAAKAKVEPIAPEVKDLDGELDDILNDLDNLA